MVPFLKGNQLYSHVDGSSTQPPPMIDNKPNPKFTRWALVDQLVISALNSSLSNSVLSQVLDCYTAHAVWMTLQDLFSTQLCDHVMHTQYQFTTLKKGIESITEYNNKAKALATSLGAAGKVLTPSEFLIYLLAGLSIDYDSLVTSLTTRPDLLTPTQLYSYLLTHESRLSHQTNTLLSSSPMQANLTTTKPASNQQFPSRGRGGHNNRCGRGPGRGPSNYFSNRVDNRPQCQVCNKHGHTALSCYYWFNQSYQAAPPPSLSANLTTIAPLHPNTTRFPDSAATNNFTNDFNNLTLDSISYQGSDQVSIGDGSILPIQNTGLAHLHSSSGNFLRTHLLYVPSISKNLLSVRQFYLDNSVYFEFHSNCLFVKDSCTREALLQGTVRYGLYVMPSHVSTTPSTSVSPQAFVGERTDTQTWHMCLVHPSPRITSHTVKTFQLTISSSKPVHNCTACYQAKSHALPNLTSPSRSTNPFELLFVDVWGPSPELSTNGSWFYLSIVDDLTKYIWLFTLQSKSDVSTFFLAFLKYVRNFFSLNVRVVQTDWGGEF